MTTHYRIATPYLRLMIQSDESLMQTLQPALVSELLTQLDEDFVDGELINQLFEAFAEQGLRSWVSSYGSHLGMGSHGAVGFAALSAANLRASLEVLCEYMVTRSSGTRAELEEDNGMLSYVLTDLTGHELAGRWLIESSFLVAQKLIETIMAHPLGTQASILFSYARPRGHAAVEKLFHAPCSYETADNRLCIPASWASVPSPLYDAETYRSNLSKAREIKLQLDADRSNVVQLVTTRLLNHFERRLSNTARRHTIPSLERLAEELNMSSRTLIRKLALQGAAYTEILEKIRRQQAESLLLETHYTAAEIADKLGYQEAANFGRAFKRWTDQSPSAWRRQQSSGK